jgi:GDSL-like Lipase/Acylhydrolase family
MDHVILLGDSIFDNARYVPGRPAVVEQLRSLLPRGWRATLLAVDGSMAGDVPQQLARLPADASHLVISVGGNDALADSGIVANAAISASEGFEAISQIQARFRQDYRDLLRAVLALQRPTVLCTVYDAVPDFPAKALTGLAVFNDVILREAFRHGLPVLDLRLVCDEARDYSSLSPIEPSEIGGAKIARGIRRIVTAHDFTRGESVVYGK